MGVVGFCSSSEAPLFAQFVAVVIVAVFVVVIAVPFLPAMERPTVFHRYVRM